MHRASASTRHTSARYEDTTGQRLGDRRRLKPPSSAMTKIISRMVPSDMAFLCSRRDFSHSTAFSKQPLNQLLLHGVPYSVFQAANSILHFPFGLVSFTLRLQLRVADHLADRLFYRTVDLLQTADFEPSMGRPPASTLVVGW